MGPDQTYWCELYFGRHRNVIGRVVSRNAAGFSERDLVIAQVNAELPEGERIAADIAAALNLKFSKDQE